MSEKLGLLPSPCFLASQLRSFLHFDSQHHFGVPAASEELLQLRTVHPGLGMSSSLLRNLCLLAQKLCENCVPKDPLRHALALLMSKSAQELQY